MKIACVYHSRDLDGWMSAAIVRYWFEKNHYHLEVYNDGEALSAANSPIGSKGSTCGFIGYDYGQPVPDLAEYDRVIMCDISFPLSRMEEIAHKLTWIDHHVSAIKEMATSEVFKASVSSQFTNVGYAACELTWLNFFDEPVPEIVRLLGRYDCFGHKGTPEEQLVLEFQYGARGKISNANEAFYALKDALGEERMYGRNYNISIEDDILAEGKAIYKYLCTEAKLIYSRAFDIELFERVHIPVVGTDSYVSRRFLCVNQDRFNPINFGINYHEQGYDGFVCFWIGKDKKVSFSLYNDNGDVDCSVIAKENGGGGHKGAAGFVVPLADLPTFISQQFSQDVK